MKKGILDQLPAMHACTLECGVVHVHMHAHTHTRTPTRVVFHQNALICLFLSPPIRLCIVHPVVLKKQEQPCGKLANTR